MEKTDVAGILAIQDLRFAYPGQPPIVAGWSESIGAGVTLLHGDIGSGKSTLLRVLAGVLPASGRLTLAGVSLERDPEAYRRRVFLCDRTADGFDQMSGRALTASLGADHAGFDQDRWQALVEGFSLAPHIDKPLYMLSTGSRHKVWLAAALASGCALTLLDEPTAGLDAASVRCLWSALTALAHQPARAVIVASTDRIDQVPLAGCVELR
ncbi:ABC transporter ATP-binding protein [Xylophilus sp. ASV27]|uniref:ABC transporter ATP-binding protein n=1 Tax=Xylophilus sp. ASV27 TaxID=2795129 RepID=UPI0018ED1ECC|nr:ATP-binding cassette domain-containing protein [Xylophilus sp. ASV27]